MNKEKLKKLIEEEFVERYDTLNEFMININNTLKLIKIEELYTYNIFCIDIEKNLLSELSNKNIEKITPKLLSSILNKMIMDKIMIDPQYEEKLTEYFSKNINEKITNN